METKIDTTKISWALVLDRLKSPVVIAQIISIVTGLIIVIIPEISDSVKVLSTAIVSMINIGAGLNNPENKTGY